MKFSFTISTTLAAAMIAGCAAPPPPPPDSPVARDGGDGQRVVSLLDYVAGDYPAAVQGGAVVNAAEYDEQQKFVSDATRLASALVPAADPLLQHVAALDKAVAAKAEASEVAVIARRARDEAVARFGLPTMPPGQPDLARAQRLYAENCTVCHAASGDAATERAAQLDPRPANFLDPALREQITAYRVYNALTFGVPGTAMASFDSLPSDQRWDLAFYVLRLSHQGLPAQGPAPGLALSDLSARTDVELARELRTAGHAQPERAVSWARVEGAWQAPAASDGVARTQRMLDRATQAFARGDAAGADGLVLDAYLQGFEPLEPTLRTRDAAGTAAVERDFHALRAAIATQDAAAVKSRAASLDARLTKIGGGGPRAVVPALAAFLIYFREGIEAALLIGAMLAGARRLGRPEAARWIHRGWIAALPAGVATWWLLERVLRWTPMQRELLEAGIALLAAAVLFSMSFWMISKVEARRWMDYLKREMESTLGARNLVLLSGLAFLAVYREAAETVLFTQALLLDAQGAASQVWAGAGAGLVAVLIVAVVMGTTVKRLPIGPFFAVSSALLCALAISFAGSGVYELVSAGILRPRPVAFPEIAWLGVHPDLSGLLVQLSIVTVIAAAAIVTYRNRLNGMGDIELGPREPGPTKS